MAVGLAHEIVGSPLSVSGTASESVRIQLTIFFMTLVYLLIPFGFRRDYTTIRRIELLPSKFLVVVL